jgi:hypothetical protein
MEPGGRNRWQPVANATAAMVRRGSTVRVRQRASKKSRKSGLSFRIDFHDRQFAVVWSRLWSFQIRGRSSGGARDLVADLAEALSDVADVFTFHGFCKHQMHRHAVAGLQEGWDYYPALIELMAADLHLLGRERSKHDIERCLLTAGGRGDRQAQRRVTPRDALRRGRAGSPWTSRTVAAYDFGWCLANRREPLVDRGPPPGMSSSLRAGRHCGCARARSGSVVVRAHRPPR